jgi:hypothetical protein
VRHGRQLGHLLHAGRGELSSKLVQVAECRCSRTSGWQGIHQHAVKSGPDRMPGKLAEQIQAAYLAAKGEPAGAGGASEPQGTRCLPPAPTRVSINRAVKVEVAVSRVLPSLTRQGPRRLAQCHLLVRLIRLPGVRDKRRAGSRPPIRPVPWPVRWLLVRASASMHFATTSFARQLVSSPHGTAIRSATCKRLPGRHTLAKRCGIGARGLRQS